ncbi:MAG: polyamine aminopropyltransferase, partial [Candidatus Kapabacteria bacterium]|nr:polyamine aminopropyltransferase [Candidatus Kapabacteria bacterium]
MHILLLFSVGIIATCGLIYELAAGTLASYLLGDSVTQFSTIIGVYLFSMGIGSFLSRYVRSYVLDVFVQVEIIVGIIGGISSALLFVLFPHIESFRVVLYAIVTLTGIFVGLEIPLLMNILRQHIEFRDMVSRVFSYDYAGALLASVIFPLLMVPYLGLVRTSFAFGSLNVAVALLLSIVLAKELHFARTLQGQSAVVLVLLLAGIYFSENIVTQAEQNIYGENIIYSTSSPYQRIVLTRHRKAIKLYLNNNLQFSSADEYRYHEALVHPAMCLHSTPPRKIAVLGGGD